MGYNFNEDLRKAEKSEMKFYNWAIAKGLEVKDVRHDVEWQKKDVDYLVNVKEDNRIAKIEIKSDKGVYQYGNLCIELKSNRYINSDGWWEHTKDNSDWLLFYMEQIDKYYKIRTKDIKKYIEEKDFDRYRNVFNSYCGFINLNNFAKWKGVELNSLLFCCN